MADFNRYVVEVTVTEETADEPPFVSEQVYSIAAVSENAAESSLDYSMKQFRYVSDWEITRIEEQNE